MKIDMNNHKQSIDYLLQICQDIFRFFIISYYFVAFYRYKCRTMAPFNCIAIKKLYNKLNIKSINCLMKLSIYFYNVLSLSHYHMLKEHI